MFAFCLFILACIHYALHQLTLFQTGVWRSCIGLVGRSASLGGQVGGRRAGETQSRAPGGPESLLTEAIVNEVTGSLQPFTGGTLTHSEGIPDMPVSVDSHCPELLFAGALCAIGQILL